MSLRLYNIPFEITQAQLVTVLQPFGPVSECRLEMNARSPRRNVGRATVVFQQPEHAQQLLEMPPTLSNRLLRISRCRQPSVRSKITSGDFEIENFAVGNWVECPNPRLHQSAWTYEKHWELGQAEQQPHLNMKQSITVLNLCFPSRETTLNHDLEIIPFLDQSLGYTLDISFHDLMDRPRGVVIDDKTTPGKVVIYLWLQRPPKIFREKTILEKMSRLMDDEDEQIRTIDPTNSRIFDGRHMVWQLTISTNPNVEQHKSKDKFNAGHGPDAGHGTNTLSADQDIMRALSLLSKHGLVHSQPRTVRVKVQSPSVLLPSVEDSFFLPFPYCVGFKIHSLLSYNHLYHSEVHKPIFLEALNSVVDAGDMTLACHVLDNLSTMDWHPGNAKSMRPYRRFAETLAGDTFLPQFNQWNATNFTDTEKFVYINHATVTPTKVWIEGPMIEPSNRILRQYRQHVDRFLRVTFAEENFEPLWTRRGTSELLEKRVRRVLDNGIVIAGREHEFLAFGSSQLKDHSCWFFASFPGCTASQIRSGMGDFSLIKSPALYGARMGQCFTATTGTIEIPDSQVVHIPDINIERMGKTYCFTDGIGKISASLAKRAIDMANLRVDTNDLPCVYQMRYGGCKGVVVVDPSLTGEELHIRRSMTKFDAPTSNTFEIVKTSARPQRAFLNRQIIMLLSALGTPDDIFMRLQDDMIDQTNLMMSDPTAAKKILRRRSMDTHVAKMTFGMLKANQLDVEEPFLYAILEATRLNILQTLKKKARIFVERSHLLFGTVDETCTLRENEVFVQVAIPDDFSDFSDSWETKETMTVIVGDVFVMRNPSLHPGDIRKMKAVRCRRLNHLKNCIVFSSMGERPAPNMMSGGDLDGDEYFVCYDTRLFPTRMYPPMDYQAGERKVVDNVEIDHIKQFFVDYIENDKLGVIANMHLALADQSDQGVFDERCIRLCQAHSDAVDFPKSGNPAVIDRDIRVTTYPDFMGKANKKRSDRILGKLYRKIAGEEDLDHIADNQWLTYQQNGDIAVDPMFLVDGFEQYLDDADTMKQAYDRDLRAIMSKYKIKTEAEAITGYILDFRPIHRRKLYDVEELVAAAISAHILKYRKLFAADVLPPHHSDARFSFLVNSDTEKKAAAWYYVTYCQQDDQSETEEEEEEEEEPHRHRRRNGRLLSFAWVVYDVLLKIRR